MSKKSNSAAAALNLTRGRRLGKYRLEKHLGRGGSCEVWKAKDCVEGMWVALKIPLTDINGVRDNEALFREIRLVTKLRHRHIMPVKNADVIDGYVVLATELSVRTLADCFKPMSVRRILSIINQVLDGLACAHRNRLVHCDVTPGNIFLFPNARAALGDFGISQQLKGRMKTIDEFGTPGYVAPEQAYGRPTYRSDCFAVALILYEYVTGFLPRWPFRWPLRGHSRFRQHTSIAMEKFIKKSLSVDPEKRFANAEQMLAALLGAMPKDYVCPRCGRGILPEWRFCPWCYGPRFDSPGTVRSSGVRYNAKCRYCGGKLMRFMRYCPWCHRKVRRSWKARPFPELCARCGWSVDSSFWSYCPWCKQSLI